MYMVFKEKSSARVGLAFLARDAVYLRIGVQQGTVDNGVHKGHARMTG